MRNLEKFKTVAEWHNARRDARRRALYRFWHPPTLRQKLRKTIFGDRLK